MADRATAGSGDSDPLLVARRCHGNFIENVPLALLMGAIVEMNGGDRRVLSGSFAALLLFRIFHVELGLRGEKATAPGRIIGHLGTLSFTMGMAGYAAYLGALAAGPCFVDTNAQQSRDIGDSDRFLQRSVGEIRGRSEPVDQAR